MGKNEQVTRKTNGARGDEGGTTGRGVREGGKEKQL